VDDANADISKDGQIYAYQNIRGAKSILLYMPASRTLWVEAIDAGSAGLDIWKLSDQKTIFEK
jgi:hypothetical protein